LNAIEKREENECELRKTLDEDERAANELEEEGKSLTLNEGFFT
jgi:hypothetical protein